MGSPFKKKKGWLEVPTDNVRKTDQEKLWGAVGQGDIEEAALILGDGGVLDAETGDVADIKDVYMTQEPDDIIGTFTRIWIKPGKRKIEFAEDPPYFT